MKIALTGGIACGKSLVAKFLRELGVATLDADDVVHELEAPGGAAVPAIAARFGAGVLAPDGGIDRARLAEVVFARERSSRAFTGLREAEAQPCAGGHDARRALEAILHPLVRARLLSFFPSRSAQAGEGARAVFAQASEGARTVFAHIAIIPLLFESHWESDYDIILCVSSSEDRQVDRMVRMRGYTREQAEARLAAQMPVAEKAARADWTIHNDSTPEQLKAEVQRCAAWLSGRMEKAT